MNELIVRGARISQDQDGYLSLTDLWRVAGRDDVKRPGQWQRLPTTKALVAALSQNVGFSHIIAETRTKSAIYSTKGKGGSTYAHHILALAYAEYLDPSIGIEVREIALRYWAGDLTLFDDFMRTRHEQFEEDGKRVFLREEIRWHNQKLAVHVREAGARSPNDYAEFHNSGYRGLYDGEDENDIHRRKQLRKDQAILDHMTPAESAANWFRTTQAEDRIRNADNVTLGDACHLHHDIGVRVRQTIEDIGGTMPEDLPVADSIGDAKRCLTAYRKSKKHLE